MTDFPVYLTKNARQALRLSDEDRINYVRRTRWIKYTLASQILHKLEVLRTHPKTHRMPNLLIVGDTNNGKTMILNHFKKLHPPSDNEQGEIINYPILLVQTPPIPDEGRMYNVILQEICAPYRERDLPDKKCFQIIHLLGQIGTQLLIFDEIHDILAGSYTKQQQVLNVIKLLGNKLQMSIIAAGTEKALNVFKSDPQLSNRFKVVSLPKWKIDGSTEKEFLSLLSSFEKTLPLWKPSHLIRKELALKLVVMSEGLIGELSTVLTEACIQGIRDKSECITLNTLRSIDWTPPSQRKM